MRLDRLTGSLLVVALFSAPAAGRAQGFGLNEIGTCAVARAASVTGAPCRDASSIFWNPAAPATLGGLSIYGGVSPIAVSGEFTADTSGQTFPGDVPTEYPAHVFINYRLQSGIALGFGAYVPYGLTTQWEQNFPGRFSAQRASLQTLYFQPNVAYSFAVGPTSSVSIGGGPVFGYSTVELRQGIDLSVVPLPSPAPAGSTFGTFGIAPGTEFARAKLKGSSTAYGFNLGVHAQLGPMVQLGARYLSKLEFQFRDATATFQAVPTGLQLAAGNLFGAPAGTPVDALVAAQFLGTGVFTKQDARTKINHPSQFQVGAGFTGLPRTTLSLDYALIQWSQFDELPVEFQGSAATRLSRTLFEDYENSWAIRGSAEYLLPNDFALRAGASHVKSPAPDVTVTPLLPDMDRNNYTVGIGVPLGAHFALDASYLRVDTEGRRGRILERASRTQTAVDLNGGFYTLDANIFSVSLKAQY